MVDWKPPRRVGGRIFREPLRCVNHCSHPLQRIPHWSSTSPSRLVHQMCSTCGFSAHGNTFGHNQRAWCSHLHSVEPFSGSVKKPTSHFQRRQSRITCRMWECLVQSQGQVEHLKCLIDIACAQIKSKTRNHPYYVLPVAANVCLRRREGDERAPCGGRRVAEALPQPNRGARHPCIGLVHRTTHTCSVGHAAGMSPRTLGLPELERLLVAQ